jgi:drug/metabolite transporter (DMT)-like permease
MIYLLLSILCSTYIVIVFKLFDRLKVDNFQAIVVNYFVAGSMGFLLNEAVIPFREIPQQDWFLKCIMIGCCFISLFNLIAYTVQKAGISITTIASKMSVCIPVVIAFFVYDDKISFLKVLGILIALLAVYLSAPKIEKNTPRENSYLFPFIIFIGSGLLDAFLNYSTASHQLDEQNLTPYFAASCFSVAALIGLCILIYRYFALSKRLSIRNIIAGVALGIPNYGSIYFLLKSLNVMKESSYVFPINNMGIVALSSILALVIFKEKLSKLNWIGVGMALVSISLIAFSS